jgi:Bacterial pre-peptidase C-terminal domain
MSKGRSIRYAVMGAFLAAFGTTAMAQAIDEVEPNFPMTSAQALTFDASGSATVNGFLDSGDADVYSFWAKAGDVVTVDIDNGIKNGPGSVDTIVAIHYPSAPANPAIQPYTVLIGNDDASAPDPGSIGAGDSYIAGQVIPADGVYYVSVAGYPNKVADGGVFLGGPGNMTGSYTLIVSGVSPLTPPPPPDPEPVPAPDPSTTPAPDPGASTPPSPFPEQVPDVQIVQIDIRPGQRGITRIDQRSTRDIPVALLSSRQFNPRLVDVRTLTFGHSGGEQSLKKCYGRGVYVNHDRRRDLVCEFDNQAAGFEPSDEMGVLRGKLKDGTPFEGTAMLKVVPTKRPSGHRWQPESWRDDDGHRRDRRHR